EQEGTYPLPEAQLDRFLFKLVVPYSNREEIGAILDRTTGAAVEAPRQVTTGVEIRRYQALIREVLVAPHVKDFAVRLVLATHPGGEFAVAATEQYVRLGASPRGAQALILAAKVRALTSGRYNIGFDDVRQVAMPALRHRLVLNFEAAAEGITSDAVVDDVLAKTPETTDGK
ncbi:MAG: AAA family ATPase, partial [Planctomycetia bacterium]